jgi:hypothetical protein
MLKLLKRAYKPLTQRLIVLIIAALLAVLCGCAFFLLQQDTSSASPQVAPVGPLQLTRQACASPLATSLCDQKNLVEQGCTVDAKTLVDGLIVRRSMTVGPLHWRSSLRDHAQLGQTGNGTLMASPKRTCSARSLNTSQNRSSVHASTRSLLSFPPCWANHLHYDRTQ